MGAETNWASGGPPHPHGEEKRTIGQGQFAVRPLPACCWVKKFLTVCLPLPYLGPGSFSTRTLVPSVHPHPAESSPSAQ